MMCLPEAEGSSMALMCARATSLTSQTLAGSSSVLPSNTDCSRLVQVFAVLSQSALHVTAVWGIAGERNSRSRAVSEHVR